jgi:serine protease Do
MNGQRLSQLIAIGIAFVAAPGDGAATPAAIPAAGAPFCSGQHADDFTALSAAARNFDHQPEATFSYCTRNSALYECLSYGSDGAVRRDRRKVRLHGTAFAYRKQNGDTLLLTNDHVAAWPAVTDAQHTVEGVPAGCKRISETLTIVDDEHDTYAKDDIPLSLVVTDPQLDISVLKTHAELQVMRWKIGHSAAIRPRDLVEVRGFPLGAFRATNVGKVVSPHDHDDYGDWDHDDFIVDALLSKGNSGSPVLGISCATGEYELVGVYHAGYSEGEALNAVIGIDQIRDLMSTLKRSPKDRGEIARIVDAGARETIAASLKSVGDVYFPFGPLVALARQEPGGTIVYAVFGKEFPANDQPLLVLEDLPSLEPGSFGTLGRIWFGSPRGLKAGELTALDAESRGAVDRALAGLRADIADRIAYRSAADADDAPATQANLRRLEKAIGRTAASRTDLAQAITDVADRWSPQAGELGARLAALYGAPAAPPQSPPAALAASGRLSEKR